MNIVLENKTPKELAKMVKEYRENKDWTQERLALEMRRSLRSIVYIEEGKRKILKRTLKLLEYKLFNT